MKKAEREKRLEQKELIVSTRRFEEFCKKYFEKVWKEIKYYVDEDEYDVDSIKANSVLTALENTYIEIYITHEADEKDLERNLSVAVNGDFLNELSKEQTAIARFNGLRGKKKKDPSDDVVLQNRQDEDVAPQDRQNEAESRGNSVTHEAQEDESFWSEDGECDGANDGENAIPGDCTDIYGSQKGKEILIEKMMEAFRKLSPIDQVVLRYWMDKEKDDKAYKVNGEKPQRTYVLRALDELGLPRRMAGAIYVRCNKAIKKLRELMKGVNPDYHDLYEPGSSNRENGSEVSCDSYRIYSDSEYDTIGEKFYTLYEDKIK